MKLFFTETQLAHQPKQYMVHGRIVDPFENPESRHHADRVA